MLRDMHKIDAHIEEVRSRLLATGIPCARLSVMAGLTPNALRRLKAPNWSCSIKTLRKLEDLLSRLEQETSSADQVAA